MSEKTISRRDLLKFGAGGAVGALGGAAGVALGLRDRQPVIVEKVESPKMAEVLAAIIDAGGEISWLNGFISQPLKGAAEPGQYLQITDPIIVIKDGAKPDPTQKFNKDDYQYFIISTNANGKANVSEVSIAQNMTINPGTNPGLPVIMTGTIEPAPINLGSAQYESVGDVGYQVAAYTNLPPSTGKGGPMPVGNAYYVLGK